MSKIFYISLSLIIIALLLYDNNNDTNNYSLKPIIETLNEELEKIKKFIKLKDQRIKEFDNLIYNYLEKNNKYNEIININEKSNIEIEKIKYRT